MFKPDKKIFFKKNVKKVLVDEGEWNAGFIPKYRDDMEE
jgi:hypothetical protein